MTSTLSKVLWATVAALVLLASGCETLHSTSFVEMPIDHGGGGGDGSAGSSGAS